MTTEQILTLIVTKIAEHKVEIEGAIKELNTLHESFKGGKMAPSLKTASQMMILKDKSMFHNACIATLEDLKQEITNG
jgi:hypothetical protein